MTRIDSIDVMRAVALAAMILCHFVIYYSPPAAAGPDAWLYFTSNHILGDMAATWFLFLVGMSQVLSAKKRESEGAFNAGKKALVRGSFIVVVGLVMLAVVWGPHEIWEWDILTLIGVATMVLFFCRSLPSWVILMICAAICVLTPWLRAGIDFLPYWGGSFVPVPFISDYVPGIMSDPASDYHVVWTLKDIVTGFFFTAYFPIFPWMAYPLLGFVIGRRIVEKRLPDDVPLLIACGVLLVVVGLQGAYASLFRPDSSTIYDYLAPLSFYPDSMTMMCLQVGVGLILFSALYYHYDAKSGMRRSIPWLSFCRSMSRYSLTVYFIHYIFIAWPLWLIYWLTGEMLLEKAIGAAPAFLMGVLVILIFQPILKFWDRHSAKYSMEWWLARATDRFTR